MAQVGCSGRGGAIPLHLDEPLAALDRKLRADTRLELLCPLRSVPTGSRIVTASWDKTARIWDAATAKEIALLRGHDGYVRSSVFGPDGTRIVTASDDKTARIWDAATAKEVAVLHGHSCSEPCSALSTSCPISPRSEALKPLAAKYGKTLPQLALRWTLSNPVIGTVLLASFSTTSGPTTMSLRRRLTATVAACTASRS